MWCTRFTFELAQDWPCRLVKVAAHVGEPRVELKGADGL